MISKYIYVFIHLRPILWLYVLIIFTLYFIQESSARLWAFMIGTFWISLVTYYLLWKAYKHVSGLRAAALMSPEVKNEQFTILVRDIPPVPEGQTRKEQVDSYFKSIYPDTFYKSMIVTDNKAVRQSSSLLYIFFPPFNFFLNLLHEYFCLLLYFLVPNSS